MKENRYSDIEKYRLDCEVRYWKQKAIKNGRAWWNDQKERIRKKRGDKGLNYLLEAMNRDEQV